MRECENRTHKHRVGKILCSRLREFNREQQTELCQLAATWEGGTKG